MMNDKHCITAQELYKMHAHGSPISVIDVRTPVEFREIHVPFSVNVPLDRISSKTVTAAARKSPVYLMCRTGRRAEEASRTLEKQGFENITLLKGGIEELDAAGFELVRGKKAVSIERQVRIAAGSLVMTGTLLGALVHPGFLVIPVFVGGGLTFAGFTDTCAMGMMLARMPWNRVNEGGDEACSR